MGPREPASERHGNRVTAPVGNKRTRSQIESREIAQWPTDATTLSLIRAKHNGNVRAERAVHLREKDFVAPAAAAPPPLDRKLAAVAQLSGVCMRIVEGEGSGKEGGGGGMRHITRKEGRWQAWQAGSRIPRPPILASFSISLSSSREPYSSLYNSAGGRQTFRPLWRPQFTAITARRNKRGWEMQMELFIPCCFSRYPPCVTTCYIQYSDGDRGDRRVDREGLAGNGLALLPCLHVVRTLTQMFPPVNCTGFAASFQSVTHQGIFIHHFRASSEIDRKSNDGKSATVSSQGLANPYLKGHK